MRLHRVSMRNFRQFYGDQEIEISDDEERNITIVHAENGVGKTTLLNAVLWAMFGITTKKFEQPEQIINFAAKAEGTTTARVEVFFSDDNDEDYLVQRHFEQGNGRPSHTLKAFKSVEGRLDPLPAPESFVRSVIPEDIAKYFFFDGEHAETFASANNSSEVNEAIRNILGCGLVECGIEDLEKLHKELNRQIGQIPGDDERQKVEDKRVKVELEVEQGKALLAEYEKEINTKERQVEQIEKKLRESEGTKGLQKVRDQKKRDLSDARQQLSAARSNIAGWVGSHGLGIVSKSLSSEGLDYIEEESSKGKIPSPYNEEFVEALLKEEVCICERPIKPGSKEFRAVQSLLEHAANADLRRKVSRARGRISALKEEAKTAPGALQTAVRQREVWSGKEALYESELKEISDKIKKLPEDQSREQEEARIELNRKIRELITSRTRLSVQLEDKNSEIKKLERERDDMDSQNDVVIGLRRRRDLVSEVFNSMKLDLEEYEESARSVILKKVNDILLNTSRRHYRAALAKDFTLSMKLDQLEGSVPKSGGENQLLSLAFIAALVEFSSQRINAQGKWIAGTVAPLVLDSPFGQLDPEYKKSTATFLPELSKQVVLFVSSSQGDERVIGAIRDKIGREYVLVSHNVGPKGEKPDDSIVLNGTEYIRSLYDQERAMTTIQDVTVREAS